MPDGLMLRAQAGDREAFAALVEPHRRERVELFTDDVWLRMPPVPWAYRGRAAAGEFLTAITAHRTRVAAMVPVRANRQPGWGEYVREASTGQLHLVGVLVVACSADRIRELTPAVGGRCDRPARCCRSRAPCS